MRPIFAVVDINLTRAHETVALLEEKGHAVSCQSLSELVAVQNREGHLDAVFIDADSVQNLLEACTAISKAFPAAVLYITGKEIPTSLWPELSDCGVKEFIKRPITTERVAKLIGFRAVVNDSVKQASKEIAATSSVPIQPAIRPMGPKLSERAAQRNLEVQRPTYGQVIAVASPKGGAGKSVIVQHLAAAYTAAGHPVVVLDSDPNGNQATGIFRLDDVSHNITEIIDTKSDRAYLDQLLITHSSGVKILSSPSYEDMNLVKKQELDKAIMDYRRYYSVVIVDLPPGFNPLTRVAMDYATRFMCVVVPDKRQFDRTEEFIDKVRSEAGEDSASVQWVINFTRPYSKTDDRALRGMLLNSSIITVPFDRSIVAGRDISKVVLKQCKQLMVRLDTPLSTPVQNQDSKKRIKKVKNKKGFPFLKRRGGLNA